jgi:PIN domain nuclease of toxin-antitoxin system
VANERVVVLDTHAWVWWLTVPAKLGKKAARVLASATRIGLPAISVWEVAMKAQAGKLKFDRPYDVWIEDAIVEDSRLEVLPITPRVSIDAAQLPWRYGDPADRFIVATARMLDARLVTADETIQESRLIKCVWD